MSGALLHAALVKLGFSVNIDLNNNSFQSTDEDGQTVTGTFTMQTTGAWLYTGDLLGNNENGTWGTPTGAGAGDPYHCRLRHVSGTNQHVGGEALNVWVALTSNRSWNLSKASAGGPDNTVGGYEIDVSDDGGSSTLDTQGFSATMMEQSP